MHIGVVSPVFPPYKGGIGAVAEAQALLLRRLGFTVTVFTPAYKAEAEVFGVERLRPLFAFGNAALVPGLFWRLRKVEIIHVHYPCYGLDFFAVLAAVIFRKPLIITYHMKASALDWRNWFFKIHRLVFEPIILRLARVIFVSSVDYGQSVGITGSKVKELAFSVDTERFKPGANDVLRHEYKITAEMLSVIFVGGLDKAHEFKGLAVLLSAISKLTNKTSLKLLVVGDGSERSGFERLALELGISEQVVFLGAVNADDLPQVYRAADVHVLPSVTAGEAFGLVTLEAAASGLPSIVSDLPGVRTLVVQGKTGFITRPGNAIDLANILKMTHDNKSELKAMGMNARKRVEDFYTEARVAEVLSQAYNRVV